MGWMLGWNGLCLRSDNRRAWNTLFFAVVWTIWVVPNELVFKEKEANFIWAMDTVKFSVAYWFKNHGCRSNEALTMILLDISEMCVKKKAVKTSVSNVWVPSGGADLCFAVDGSALGNSGMTSIGGALRNAEGRILCLFSSFLGIFDAITAEVYAIQRDCKLMASKHQLNDWKVEVVSDSKSTVAWVNGEGFGNFKLVQLIYDIHAFLCKFEGVSIFFRSRAAKSLVDSLAKLGSGRLGDRMEWGDL
ncbi:hypothetical protein Dsin_003719 [Dipteronia sinensis]|uniref:RNase H type-1 domain-containing protein n=1 Tax=Dipteronia sinensis TaxID=43782 RepID=A0AAE0B885_9ROSI|nr:hypothetical protein Dsin_003719 [Dipteronia sinensis]